MRKSTQSLIRLSLVVSLVTGAVLVFVAISQAASSQVINGFRYTSCSSLECVEVLSEKAWVSVVGEGFSTTPPTQLRVLDRAGKLKSTHVGATSTLNQRLGIITLEGAKGAVLLYSLKDSNLSTFPGMK